MTKKTVLFVKEVMASFKRSRCGLHAAGLTYFTLLTTVPVLCLLLLLAKTCGVGDFARNQINQRIDAMIQEVETAPEKSTLPIPVSDEEREKKKIAAREFATQARTYSNQIFDRIDAFDVSTLGWIGLLFLAWSVVSTFGMVEDSMNDVWGIKTPRPLWKRCCLYLFEALVLPLLAMFALSMPVLRVVRKALDATVGASSYTKWVGDALIAILDSKIFVFLFTLFFASLAFAFVLSFMPNAKVRFRPAMASGVVTALLFGGWLKLCACAQVGIAKSSALYGSFAFLPIVLAWIYVSWQIVLLGSNFAHAFQNPHILGGGPDDGPRGDA